MQGGGRGEGSSKMSYQAGRGELGAKPRLRGTRVGGKTNDPQGREKKDQLRRRKEKYGVSQGWAY